MSHNQENNACNSSPYLGLMMMHTWLWMTGWWGSWRWCIGHWTHTSSLWWIFRTRALSLSEVVGTFEYTLIKSSDTLESLLPEPKTYVLTVFKLQKLTYVVLKISHTQQKSKNFWASSSETKLSPQAWFSTIIN